MPVAPPVTTATRSGWAIEPRVVEGQSGVRHGQGGYVPAADVGDEEARLAVDEAERDVRRRGEHRALRVVGDEHGPARAARYQVHGVGPIRDDVEVALLVEGQAVREGAVQNG